jgi:hypothetical protein
MASGRPTLWWAAKVRVATAFCLAGAVAGTGLYFGNLAYVTAGDEAARAAAARLAAERQARSFGSSQGAPPTQLEQALLPADTLGPGGSILGAGTDLSQIALICGGPLSGVTATAYETIQDSQTGQFMEETLTAWGNAANARKAGLMDHQALDQSGSCSTSNAGATATYTGDYAGSPPSGCSSGQYLATSATLSSPSPILSYSGYLVETLCGTVSVVVMVASDLGGITRATVDGYLNIAVDHLESAGR